MRRSLVFWFTGLSGSGKTTLATAVKGLLEEKGLKVLIMDGDQVREKHHPDLGFTEADIKKNNELIARRCSELKKDYDVILVPVISPYIESRRKAREILGGGFYEVYVSADLKCVIARDTKGLYRKARNNEIKNLIGFSPSNPYEAPPAPDLVIPTHEKTREESVETLRRFVWRCLSEGV